MWKTVFARRHQPWEHINEMAVMYSHRAAFILYAIYSVWAVLSGAIAIQQQNFHFTFWFAWCILPVAVLSALGALYFPRLARLEMSAAVILVTLLITFEVNQVYFLFQDADPVHPGFDFSFSALNNAVLDASFAVVPLARAAFVFFAFIMTGTKKGDKA